MAQIIMIASGKGGTGKSTFATFLATELALMGHKTLLTELDAGLRSIDVISGVSGCAVYDIGDVLAGRCNAQKAMITSPYTENLFIIPAPFMAAEVDFSSLKQQLDALYADFKYIIIDTAAGLGNAFHAAANAANAAIIVATADLVSVRDARLVSDTLYEEGVCDIRLVINKFEKNAFKHAGFQDLDEVIDGVCAQLLGLIPNAQEIMVSAIKGVPLPVQRQEKQIFLAIAQRLTGMQRQIIIQ